MGSMGPGNPQFIHGSDSLGQGSLYFPGVVNSNCRIEPDPSNVWISLRAASCATQTSGPSTATQRQQVTGRSSP